MDIHEPCIYCKYWRLSRYAQPQPGCSHERHQHLFRVDDILATFMYYDTAPSNVLFDTDDVNRKRVSDSTRRLEAVIRSHDDVYGITGIIILLESILYVNSVHQKLQMDCACHYGLYPPAAEHIRPDYPVPPRQQTPSFSNSLVSFTSAQQSQQTPSFSDSLVSTSGQQSQHTPSFSNSLVASTSAQQSQNHQCAACIYFARHCSEDCWFAQFFQPDFWGDFEAVCRTKFERKFYAYNTRTSRLELTGDEITRLRTATTLFEREIRAITCPDYGATGIVISLIDRLIAVNTSIDFLHEILADRVQQQVAQYQSRLVTRYPAPTNVNTGGPGRQQQQQFQRGGAKRSLEQGGPPIPQQRPRLPLPPNQPAGLWPQQQQPAHFVLLHHPTPFQQPSYHLQLQGYQARPLLQSQLPAMPFQSQQLLAGMKSSSTATSSQSLFQSQQQHYFSTGGSSSGAAVGQPHQEQKQLNQGLSLYQVQMQGYQRPPLPQSQPPAVPFQSQQLLAGINSSSSATATSQFQSQHQHYFNTVSSSLAAAGGQPDPYHPAPPDQYGFAGIQFTGDEENTYWDTEQERFAEEQKRLAEEHKRLNQGPPGNPWG